MKNIKNTNAGITLIALVITIIVLLILAGITINLTIGQDGILKRAEEAGKNYTEAAKKEKTEIAEFSNLADKIINNVTKQHYTIVEGVPVPNGFTHIAGTKDTGFVIKNDTDGNEFVWVPCTIDGENGSIKYDRYAFLTGQPAAKRDTVTSSIKIKNSTNDDYVYTETMPSAEKQSVQEYGGYYIGRYESGVIGYDKNILTSNNNNITEWTGYTGGKLAIKSGQQVWNYITRDKAKKVSEGLYSKAKGDSVNSKLCSSYAWDTALKFIDTKNPGYSTNSAQGNYKDKTFQYIGINGETQNKEANEATLVPTGQTTAVNNIYDMGGNTWEWTTEVCDYDSKICTGRGGAYNSTSSGSSAPYRACDTTSSAHPDLSFRTTLYL